MENTDYQSLLRDNALLAGFRENVSGVFATSEMLFSALEQMNNPTFARQSAAITRGLCRLLRTTDSLERLRSFDEDTAFFNPEQTDLESFVMRLIDELNVYIPASGRSFDYSISKNPGEADFDRQMMENAMLNMAAAALGASEQGGEIHFSLRSESNVISIVFAAYGSKWATDMFMSLDKAMNNGCDPLRFRTRLSVAVARAVAVRHGGTLFIARTGEDSAAVSMAIPRILRANICKNPSAYDLRGGFPNSLIQLSEYLPTESYSFFF